MEYPESVFANERVTCMVPTEQHGLSCGPKAVVADASQRCQWRHRDGQTWLNPNLRQWVLALGWAGLASVGLANVGWAEVGLGDDRLAIPQPTGPVAPNPAVPRHWGTAQAPQSPVVKAPGAPSASRQRPVELNPVALNPRQERPTIDRQSLEITLDDQVVGIQPTTRYPDVNQGSYLSQTDGVSPLEPTAENPPEASPSTPLDLDPEVLENSPVLQDWLQEIPDIADEIRNSPSFRTRLRLGYAQFPSNGQIVGFNAGIEDVFVIPGAGLTVSGDYARSWNGQRESYGAEVRYYLLPLGGFVNLAPTVGYRSLTTPQYQTDGVNVGFRVMFVPSRGGAADVAVSQQWVSPGGADEVGLTSLSVGYAVTRQLRLSTDFQFQNSNFRQDSRLGLNLEWLL
jgi:hypothetical protein